MKKISEKRSELLSTKLPEKLVDFLDSKEYKKTAGRYIYAIKDRIFDDKERLLIDEEKLDLLYKYSHDDNSNIKYCPLYTFKNGSYYFGVDISKEELPVVFYDYSGGFSIYAESLDIFLTIPLEKKGDLTPLEILVNNYYKTDDNFDNEEFESGIIILKGILEENVPKGLSEHSEYQVLLSWIHYRLGHFYYNIDDFENATIHYKAAAKAGWSIAYFDLCEIFKRVLHNTEELGYYLDKINKEYHVFEYIDYDDENAYEKAWFIPRINFAYLHILKGNIKEALNLYKEIEQKDGELKEEFVKEIKEDLKYLKKEKYCSASDYKEMLAIFVD